MRREAQEVLTRLDVSLNVSDPARGLTLAQQQTVEIAKAISLNVRVLIMDEPTASLSAHEVNQLFRIIAALRRQGVAILFISHRMEEVFQIADRVTVLRDGRWISTRPATEVTPASAIRDMVGREIQELFKRPESHPGEVVLAVQGLGREGAFRDVSFELRAGEVLGFAGLVGARRTDVGLAIFGIAPADSGTILLDGQPIIIRSPQDAVRLRIAYTTEDRRRHGSRLPAVHRGQYLVAIPAQVPDRRRAAASVHGARDRRDLSGPITYPGALGGHAGQRPLRWQPAEGRAQQVAGDPAAGAHPR